MPLTIKRKLTLVTVVYWVLLLYMLAALVWWFIALQNQNSLMANMRLVQLKKDDPSYLQKVAVISDSQKRKTAQYIGEGITFLALIIIGAVFVFRAVRRQIKLAQQQQNFMMAVTHELKTPIAITRLNLETLQKRQLQEDVQRKLISNTLQETSRLNTLCNNILLAAQLEAGLNASSKQEINFSELVEGCVEDFVNRYPNRSISSIINESIYINGEEILLQMLVNNLLENALKYSPKESIITIKCAEEKHTIRLQIIDEGIGIAEFDKKKIFDKFYRAGDENVRTTKGTGLGLYLCKKIVEGHKGNIAVVDNQPQGSIFTAVFSIA
ncbi:MAG: two-component sensor histidine kinase [Deinococcales bacterium]|nr:two-component sensor histidine kinase [Chitinophagaceae bacterium]